jgi:hypothetical protein
MRMLGRMTVSHDGVRCELVARGLATDCGAQLEITEAGRHYVDAHVGASDDA